MLKQKQLAAVLLGLALATAAIAQPKSVAPANQPDPAIQARMKEAEDKLARAAEEEAKRAAVLKAYEEEQAERQKQLAKEKQERDALRARAAYEAQCQFKSVMSDEDIARCRSIHRN
jgi:hypothetical protein